MTVIFICVCITRTFFSETKNIMTFTIFNAKTIILCVYVCGNEINLEY